MQVTRPIPAKSYTKGSGHLLNHPSGGSPNSVLDSSAHSPPRLSSSPDYICYPTRHIHDPEVMKDPVDLMNSGLYSFHRSGYIKGPGSDGSTQYVGRVHDLDSLQQFPHGYQNTVTVEAKWGDLVKPADQMPDPTLLVGGPGKFTAHPSREYVNDGPRSACREFNVSQLRLIGVKPDIALHGQAKFRVYRDGMGPGGLITQDYRTAVKDFSVRVPLERALLRAVPRRVPKAN